LTYINIPTPGRPQLCSQKNMDKILTSRLLALCACVFMGYLTVGLSLGALPLYIHEKLGFNNLIVGLTIGLQSAATLASRHRAGTLCDTRGSRLAVTSGAILCSVAGLGYLASLAAGSGALAVLLIARVILGVGESLLITGALSWGIGLAGVQRSGKVMAWVGIAMYGALACGASLSGLLGTPVASFIAVAVAPLPGLVCLLSLPGISPGHRARIPFHTVIGLVGRPGAGLALAAVSMSCIASFVGLYFTKRGWAGASLALTVFGTAYILVRLFLAHLPDTYGGARVARVSLLVESAGQVLLWLAPSPLVALAGAALTGMGFSLVFPAFGVEAVRRVSPENKGVVLGAYVAFFDLSLGITAPLAGWLAGHSGYAPIYALGAAAAALSALLTLTLGSNP
jgi:predicted MFS family arabinose efflux permease